MIKYTALIAIIAIRILYHPSSVNSATEAFSKPAVYPATRATNHPAKPNKIENPFGRDKLV